MTARAAGLLATTLPTVAGGTGYPIMKTIMKPMAARMTFMMTPAETMSILAPTDFLL